MKTVVLKGWDHAHISRSGCHRTGKMISASVFAHDGIFPTSVVTNDGSIPMAPKSGVMLRSGNFVFPVEVDTNGKEVTVRVPNGLKVEVIKG